MSMMTHKQAVALVLSEDMLLKSREAAGFLGVSYRTLEVWRAKGAGPQYIKHPGKIVYRLSVLKKYLEAAQAK